MLLPKFWMTKWVFLSCDEQHLDSSCKEIFCERRITIIQNRG